MQVGILTPEQNNNVTSNIKSESAIHTEIEGTNDSKT